MDFLKKPLLKSNSDKKIYGVCGGIAKRIGVDSSWIRLIWLCSMVFWLFGATCIYMIFAISLSYESETENYNDEQQAIDVEFKES